MALVSSFAKQTSAILQRLQSPLPHSIVGLTLMPTIGVEMASALMMHIVSRLSFLALSRLRLLRPLEDPMSSQLDLDQGGTFRQTQRVYLGPSVGWVSAPQEAVLSITAAGTYNLLRGMNLVTINVNGNVTINLPSALASTAGPQAIPGQYLLLPVTIGDIGGFAPTNTYRINPFGAETISGLAFVTITTSYGSIVFQPLLQTGGWTMLQ